MFGQIVNMKIWHQLNSVDPQTKTTSFRPNPEYHHGVGDDNNNNNNKNNNNNNKKKDTPLPNLNIDTQKTQNDGFNMYLSLYQIWFLLSVSMLNFRGVCDVKMLLLLNYSSTSIHMYPGCGNLSESLYENFRDTIVYPRIGFSTALVFWPASSWLERAGHMVEIP